jgi:hypothetical protein
MALIAKVSASVRPANANQCIIRQLVSGEAIDVGEAVYIKAADGLAWLVTGAAAASAYCAGVVVAIGSTGQVTGVGAGEMLSVVMSGPVAGFTLDAGDLIYVSDTAGALGDVAGTHVSVAGIGLPDSLLLVGALPVVA